jgi:plastocyanin
MKTKIIVLLLILGAVLLSGCAGNKQLPSPEENSTVVEEPQENVTDVENVTAEETGASEENITSEENETAGASEISNPDIKEAAYQIRLKDYRASASSVEIKKGEKVAWINMQENPTRILTLVSEEKLFENKRLNYRRPFVYTFNETGEYNFSIIGQPRMNVSVNVVQP